MLAIFGSRVGARWVKSMPLCCATSVRRRAAGTPRSPPEPRRSRKTTAATAAAKATITTNRRFEGWSIGLNDIVSVPMRRLIFFTSLAAVLPLSGCRHGEQATRFKLLTPSQTGITFANTVTTTDSLNAVTDPYVYNGAGVAVGDIDNDGLPDLFFTGNLVSSRLYLNKGNLRFEDITQP